MPVYKADVFIAYSLNEYSSNISADFERSHVVAKALKEELEKNGFTCILHSPSESEQSFENTPVLAKSCKLFLMVVDEGVFKKTNDNGRLKDDTWSIKELQGFLSKDCYKVHDSKSGYVNAKEDVRLFLANLSIPDLQFNNLHEVFENNPPIRTKSALMNWVKARLMGGGHSTLPDIASSWDIETASFWETMYPPIRPSTSEIEFYSRFLREKQEDRPPRVLILGSTLEFIHMCLGAGIQDIAIVDSSVEYCKQVLSRVDENDLNKITTIYCDWSEMETNSELTPESYDIILGDLAIGNVPPDRLDATVKAISSLLCYKGYWLGKNICRRNSSGSGGKTALVSLMKNVCAKMDASSPTSVEAAFAETIYKVALYATANPRGRSSQPKDPLVGSYSEIRFGLFSSVLEEALNEPTASDSEKELFSVFNRISSKLSKKKLKFYIYRVQTLVSIAMKNNLIVSDVGFGNDIYSPDFPLIVFEKKRIRSYYDNGIEATLKSIACFFQEHYDESTSVSSWVKMLQSQYHIVKLQKAISSSEIISGYVGAGTVWQKIQQGIISEITGEDLREDNRSTSEEPMIGAGESPKALVSLGLNSKLNCVIRGIQISRLDRELQFINNISILSDDAKNKLIVNYQYAILLLLSSALPNLDEGEVSLWTLVLHKLMHSLYNRDLRCWEPREAPWLTAKICISAADVKMREAERVYFKQAIDRMIETYKKDTHDWFCPVGSPLESIALCVDALIDFQGKNADYKERIQAVFKNLLEGYVLNGRLYDTIVHYPLGRFAFSKLPKTQAELDKDLEDGAPHQKQIINRVSFFSSLLRIICIALSDGLFDDREKNEELYKCGNIIAHRLIEFWEMFEKSKDLYSIIEYINIVDVGTVPQILYSLLQCLLDYHTLLQERTK